ncbi:immunity 70 family protein [Klebsiella sp. BIGb0407]|uniref:immunity 70 family protein n=1 Tax=Klebsiella sp. BIGb0407 TaxID=2940603 RepID=UPI002169C374|nr:immunity 70 family protein [Klebsiella sp. BIGb0407]MCS3430491.1 hypothetical protein [Klebsiella sp. BIGb0407]
MEQIGILGTSTIFGLGTSEDIDLFFTSVSKILEQDRWGSCYPIVMLKLYKKSLNLEEIKKAKIEVDDIQLKFSQTILNSKLSSELDIDMNKTAWNIHTDNLSSFFDRFFKGFNTAYIMTLSLNDKYGVYSPMLLGGTSIKSATEDIMRPIEEYDRLSEGDLPFWKR